MNMKKVLAAGIAATLAVSSLAAVASAEETRSFDMVNTYGSVKFAPKVIKGAEAIDPGDDYDFFKTTDAKTGEIQTRNFKTSSAVKNVNTGTPEADGLLADTNGDGVVSELDWDLFIPFEVTGYPAALLSKVGDLTITIKGRKLASDGATTVDLVQTAKLLPVKDVNGKTEANYILPIYNNGGPVSGAFIPERFVQIDEISFNVSVNGEETAKNLDKEDYDYLKTAANNGVAINAALGKSGTDWLMYPLDSDGLIVEAKSSNYQGFTVDKGAYVQIKLHKPYEASASGRYDKSANLVYSLDAYYTGTKEVDGTPFSIADGIAAGDMTDPDNVAGTIAGTNCDGMLLYSKIRSMVQTGIQVGFVLNKDTFATEDIPAWLPVTDWTGVDGWLEREDIWMLSQVRDYNAGGAAAWANGAEVIGDNQTYNVVDYNKGTKPRGFAGLASQVADFFNKQLNGKIEFVFDAYTPAVVADTWKTGGIPSTEVGLKNFIEAAQIKDFALFVNYNSSTGSLQSDATLDKTSGSVIFDISDTLQDMGGWTKGNVNDLYYGLVNGIVYDGGEGLWVSKVILSFDPDTAVSGDTATKEDEKEEEVKEDDKGDVVVADDDDDEIEIADDDDDDDDSAIVIGDDDEDDATVVVTPDDDATVVVNPGTDKTPAGADENPHTGVALAVVPMIAAAAAMVISKKRK
jgi:hypothetical protein